MKTTKYTTKTSFVHKYILLCIVYTLKKVTRNIIKVKKTINIMQIHKINRKQAITNFVFDIDKFSHMEPFHCQSFEVNYKLST